MSKSHHGKNMFIDMLVKIKNAQAVKAETLKVPFSNMDMTVAEMLAKYGYLEGVTKKGRMPKRVIEIKLKYDNGKGVINGVKVISRPSRRLYAKSVGLKSVKQGYGVGFVSTSKGIMSNQEARKQNLGGQLLFEVW